MKKYVSILLTTLLISLLLANTAFAAAAKKFTDVPDNAWYGNTVYTLVESGIIDGFPDGTFKSQNTVAVDQFIKMAVVAAGNKVVPQEGYWAQAYIDLATSKGLIQSGEFQDYKRPITRGEMARILVRALKETSKDDISSYTKLIKDYDKTAAGYKEYILKATAYGLMQGYPDGTFKYENNATRAEAATMIHRLIDESVRINPDAIDVAMPADKDFKPYIAELTPIDPEILKELQGYEDNKDGETMFGTNEYVSNEGLIKELGIDTVTECVTLVKSFMEVENNVDYRSNDDTFIQQYRYFFMPGTGREWRVNGIMYNAEEYIKLRYDNVNKYKIIQKAEFLTDTSLNYNDKNGEYRIRGRLKFVFESVDPQYFKDYGLPVYELNKWYYSDVEVSIAIFASREPNKWPHSLDTYRGRTYLTDVILPY